MQRNKVFIDIEANQTKDKQIKLLEISAIKQNLNNQIIDDLSLEAYQEEPLSKRIAELLSKDQYYYRNANLKEREVYDEFYKFSFDCDIYCWGNYDQTILSAIQRRYKMASIHLIDFSEIIKNELNLKDSLSIKKMSTILNIDKKDLSHHDSLDDARLLRYIVNKYNNLNQDEKIILEQNIYYENLRPKTNCKCWDCTCNKCKCNNNYFKVWIYTKNKSYKIKEDINSESEITKYNFSIHLKIFNEKNNLIDDKKINQTFNSLEQRTNFKKQFYNDNIFIYFNKAIFISNSFDDFKTFKKDEPNFDNIDNYFYLVYNKPLIDHETLIAIDNFWSSDNCNFSKNWYRE